MNYKPKNCRYCKRRMLKAADDRLRNQPLSATRDHIIPKHSGGNRKVWCCRQCNQIKAGMSLMQWATFMQDNPKWWEAYRSHSCVARKERIKRAIRMRLMTFPFGVAAPDMCRGLA